MIRQVGVPHQRANRYTTVSVRGYLCQIEMVNIHKGRWRFDTVLHQIDKVRPSSQKLCSLRGPRANRIVGRCRPLIVEGIHADTPLVTARTAATMLGYAPHRQIFPLIRSRISSSESGACRSSSFRCSLTNATAEHSWPGVQYPH